MPTFSPLARPLSSRPLAQDKFIDAANRRRAVCGCSWCSVQTFFFFFFSRSAVVMASDREVEAVRRCLELAQAAQDKSK